MDADSRGIQPVQEKGGFELNESAQDRGPGPPEKDMAIAGIGPGRAGEREPAEEDRHHAAGSQAGGRGRRRWWQPGR